VVRGGKPVFAVECKTGERSLARNICYFAQRTRIPCFYQVHRGRQDFEVAEHKARVLPVTALARILGV